MPAIKNVEKLEIEPTVPRLQFRIQNAVSTVAHHLNRAASSVNGSLLLGRKGKHLVAGGVHHQRKISEPILERSAFVGWLAWAQKEQGNTRDREQSSRD